MNIRCIRLLILAAGAGALALPAAGQQLEEIVVTATKREESLQEVPLAITTVDGVLLTDYSISNFYDMNIPGVNIAQGGMNDNAFIRGVGQSMRQRSAHRSVSSTGLVAQLAEQRTFNPKVVGSRPTRPTRFERPGK